MSFLLKGTLHKVERISFGDYMAPTRKVWLIRLESGEDFDEYRTKAAAIKDAKAYGISLTQEAK